MIAQNFEYTRPQSLAEALELLSDGSAKVLAGGMSLIPLMKLRLAAPDRVVDIARLPELNYIREEDGAIHIGAGVTHEQIASSAQLRARCPLLAETAARIGDPQVRNRGTIGGSVAHADPAADYPAALYALDTQVVVTGAGGDRTLSLDDFLIDTFTTALDPGEIVRGIIVPVETQNAGYNYQKVLQPASGFAIVGIAVRLVKEGGNISTVRVGVTGLAPKPFRAANVEDALHGKPGTADNLQHASALIADNVDANRDIHASADYRKHLARVYCMRALAVASSRIP
jgi:aerobic carbon-monoxide dehydrogenase medium subunit